MKKRFGIALSTIMVIASSNAYAKPPEQLTPLQLQALQSKEFSASKEDVFSALMNVFQDLGYQLQTADLQTGFITATSQTVNKTSLLQAFANVSSSGNTKVTATVTRQPNNTTRIRLNFLNTTNSSTNYGQNFQHDQQILDAKVYTSVWDKVDEALFMGNAEKATTPASQSSSSSAAGSDQKAAISH